MALLEVEDLRTQLHSRRGINKAVNGVSFKLDTGKSLGLVGESGSGKSMTALSILRLVPQPYARIAGGAIRFEGHDLLEKSDREMRQIRGGSIAIILQDPMTSLNPVFSIGYQIAESVRIHQRLCDSATGTGTFRGLADRGYATMCGVMRGCPCRARAGTCLLKVCKSRMSLCFCQPFVQLRPPAPS